MAGDQGVAVMGLAPIPSSMLRETAHFYIPNGMDRYQHMRDTQHVSVSNVHLQKSVDVIKGPDNTEIQLRGILFIDVRKSEPAEDWGQTLQTAMAVGGDLSVRVEGPGYINHGTFSVLDVIDVPDVPADRTHHWEILLV